MKKFFPLPAIALLFVLEAVVVLLAGWDDSKAPLPKPTEAKTTEVRAEPRIKIKPETALKLRDLQVKVLLNQQRLQQLNQQQEQASSELNAAVNALFTTHGVTREGYSLDESTWELVRNPDPKPDAAKPEQKPAEKPTTLQEKAPAKKK